MQVFKYEPYSGIRLPTEEQLKIAAENYRKRRPPPPKPTKPLTPGMMREAIKRGLKRPGK